MTAVRFDPRETPRRYGNAIAVLILITIVFGGLGESYIPGRIIVTGDAAATARNIV